MGSSASDNLVFGSAAVFWIAGIVIWMIRTRHGSQGKAIAKGIGVVFAGLIVIWFGYMGSGVLRCARLAAEQMICQKNMMKLGIATLQYAEDHNEHLPPANTWATDIMPYLSPDDRKRVFHCPDANTPYSYAFNTTVSGDSLDNIPRPADTVMLFESDANTLNANGSEADFDFDRHSGMSNVVYVDGVVRGINRYSISSLRWKP
jgi:prepilin-type processing-associated H-X9-DG protein